MTLALPDLPERTDEGFTLIEVLVAVTLLGVSVVAIVSGLMTGIIASDIDAKQATGETLLRSYAEATKQHVLTSYSPCAATYAPAFTPPAGYSFKPITVQYRNGAAWSSACPGGVNVVQRLTLEVSSADDRTQEVVHIVVRRP